jgi:hypothetical protein
MQVTELQVQRSLAALTIEAVPGALAQRMVGRLVCDRLR